MKHVAAVALSILFAAVGCTREGAREAADGKPVPPPAALLVDVALPSLDGGLAGVRQFVEAVQPGAGIMVSERHFLGMAGLGTLDGAAGDKPAHVLLVEPGKHAKPLAVLVGVTDAAKLKASAKTAGLELREKGGHALLGDKAVVALLADWALGPLSKQKAPAMPVATAHSATLLATYRDDIEQAGAKLKESMAALPGTTPGTADIMDYYTKGAIALLEGSDRLEVRVEANATEASLGLGVVGKKDTKIAGFIAAQAPSDFALLERLPAGPSNFVMAGKLLLGPIRADMMALFEKAIVSMYKMPASTEMKAILTTWADSATGDMAATVEMSPGAMRMTQLIGAQNASKLHAATGAFFATWGGKPIEVTSMGATTRYSATPNAVTVDGVAFHRFRSQVDTSKMPPDQAQLATMMGKEFVGLVGAWDDVLGVSMGGDEAAAKRLVEASRRKTERLTLSPRVAAELADARARKESFYYFMDFGAMMAAFAPATGMPFRGSLGLTMALGFANGTAQLRIAMKSADVKGIIAAGAAMGAK